MPRKVTINEDFNYSALGVDPLWVHFSGYKARRVAESYENTISMATEAAAGALDMAGLDPKEIDLLIFVNGTFDAESVCPAGAPKIAGDLGATRALALSMRDGCHGFMLAMDQAAKMIQAGIYRHVLVVTAEIFSRHVDSSTKLNLRLGMAMGDGAGALVLSAGEREPGLISAFAETRSDLARSVAMQAKTIFSLKHGMQTGLFFCFLKSKDSRRDSRNKEKIETEFDKLKEMTLKIVPLAVNSAVERAGIRKQDVNLFIFHQPNRMFLEEWRERLGIPQDKLFDTLEQYGNISNCALPVNLFEALRTGRIKTGDTICLAAMGEGTGYGSQIWRWTAPNSVQAVPGPVSRSLRNEGRLHRELVNSDKYNAVDLMQGFVKPGRIERLGWDEAHSEFVNVHGFAENVPIEKAWDYISDIRTLEEWTMSVRNIRPMPDLNGRKRYQSEDILAPGGEIYFLENKIPESRTVEWWVGHHPEDIWMYYCMRVLDGELIMGRPGSVVTWVNFAHANFQRHEMLAKGFRLMPIAHGIERDNLMKILVHRFAGHGDVGGDSK